MTNTKEQIIEKIEAYIHVGMDSEAYELLQDIKAFLSQPDKHSIWKKYPELPRNSLENVCSLLNGELSLGKSHSLRSGFGICKQAESNPNYTNENFLINKDVIWCYESDLIAQITNKESK